MKNFLKRLTSYKANVDWLAKLMGGKLTAAKYLIATKYKKGDPLGTGHFGHLDFVFRRKDMTALHEVLVDQEYSFLKPHVSHNNLMNILDIGAHIGTFALWLLSENRHARIFSLEADSDTFSILEKNRKLAAHHGLTWRTLNRAAWKEETVLTFSNSGDSMSHKLSEEGNIKILGISFEKLIEQSKYDLIHLMKVDIEGAEETFLTANPNLLKRIEMLVIEIHPKMCNETVIRELLTKYYEIVEDIPNRKSSKPLLFCRKYA